MPDGPIASVESPRGMPPPIAASSFGSPKPARPSCAATCLGRVVSRRGNASNPSLPSRKLCWPDIISAPRIFSTRSRRRSIGPLRLVLELDDPVGDRELRLGARLLGAVLADQDQQGFAVGDLAREVVDGAPELARLDDVVQRLAAVDHDHRRPALDAAAEDLVRRARETRGVVVDKVGQVDELDALTERAVVEERERRQVAHQLVVRLRPGRVVDRRPLGRRVGEAHLLREDRLAAARRAADHEQRACCNASAEDRVERRVAGRQHRHGLSISSLRFEQHCRVEGLAQEHVGLGTPFGAWAGADEDHGMPAVRGFFRIRSISSAPFITGIMKSVETRSYSRLALEQLRCGPAVGRLVDVVAACLERRAKEKPHAGLVIDDQDVCHGPRPLGRQWAQPYPSRRRTFCRRAAPRLLGMPTIARADARRRRPPDGRRSRAFARLLPRSDRTGAARSGRRPRDARRRRRAAAALDRAAGRPARGRAIRASSTSHCSCRRGSISRAGSRMRHATRSADRGLGPLRQRGALSARPRPPRDRDLLGPAA